jgi:hypothetical protein
LCYNILIETNQGIDEMKAFADIKKEVQDKYNEALAGARKDCGRGIYRSRGKWIVVTEKIGAGELEWNGTKKQLVEVVAEYAGKEGVNGIYIDGGIDFGENFAAFEEGWHEAWVADYSVAIWEK